MEQPVFDRTSYRIPGCGRVDAHRPANLTVAWPLSPPADVLFYEADYLELSGIHSWRETVLFLHFAPLPP